MKKSLQKLSSLSIFFPAYNEEENIVLALRQAITIAPKIADKYEIIVINDGSTDATANVVKKCVDRHPHIRLVSQKNIGYGGALKRGFAEAKFEWIFFTDGDRQFDLKELLTFLPSAQSHEAVIGYRKNRAEGLRRSLLARALKIWNRVLLGFPSHIRDVDCAFKLIRTRVIRDIEPLFSDGAMISTELLLKLHFRGYTIAQVGVTHLPRRFGTPTGNNMGVILRAIHDTFQLQKRLARTRISTQQQRAGLRWQALLAIVSINARNMFGRLG